MVAIMAMRDRSVAWCVLQPPLARWPPWLAASPPQSKPSRSLAAQWLWLAKSSPPNSRCPQTARLSRSTCPPRKEVGSTSAIHFRWFWFTLAKMDGRVSCGMKKSACDQYWWWAWMSSPVLFWVFFYLFFYVWWKSFHGQKFVSSVFCEVFFCLHFIQVVYKLLLSIEL